MKKKLISYWKEQTTPGKRLWTWAGVLALVGLGWAAVASLSSTPAEAQAFNSSATTLVQRGPLNISVSESGTVRPRKQIVLRNELNDPATILFVVEEGKHVKKGDRLVELDVTRLENDVVERRIRVQNDEADRIHAEENLKVVKNQSQADLDKAELTYEFAKQDLDKYLEGEYPKLLKEARAKITLAEEERSRAEEDLKWSRTLFEEKYLSQSELQQDQLAFNKADLNLELAKTDLNLLEEYTKARQVAQLKSDVKQAKMALERAEATTKANLAQAEAALRAREAQLVEEKARLARYEALLEKAVIDAPIDGMVLYATSVGDRWRRNDDPIEIGTVVDERDEIIYLPTASEFNVDVKVTEVDLNKVRPGLRAKVRVDAIPDKVFYGTVSGIAQLPDSDSRYLNPNLKLYETDIELDPNQADLRNGMSCRVEIEVEHFDDVRFVPIQSVVRVAGQPTVYVVGSDGVVMPREIEIGLDNGRFVHVTDGVEAGERILLAPPLKGGSGETETDALTEAEPAPGRQSETPAGT